MDFTTKLSAVNTMLATIGEAPVNSLNIGIPDVEKAVSTLDEVTRLVLTEGFTFNTDLNYPWFPAPDAPNEIIIPPNVLVLNPTADFSFVVRRGDRLYNRDTRSFSFTPGTPVTAEVVWFQDFGDLPEFTRHYIAIRAARVFQGRTLGSALVNQFTESDEYQALLNHKRHTRKARKKNILTSPAMSNLLQR